MATDLAWMRPLVESHPAGWLLSECLVFKFTHHGARPARRGEWLLLRPTPEQPTCGSIGFIRITKRILAYLSAYLSSRIVLCSVFQNLNSVLNSILNSVLKNRLGQGSKQRVFDTCGSWEIFVGNPWERACCTFSGFACCPGARPLDLIFWDQGPNWNKTFVFWFATFQIFFEKFREKF